MQDRHVQLHDTITGAARAHALMSTHPGITMDGMQRKRWQPDGRNESFMSEGIDKIARDLLKEKSFQDMPPEYQRELLDHLRDSAIAVLSYTRAQSHRLPRRFVEGFSQDLPRNTSIYASSSAGYRARQQYAPEIDRIVKQMTEWDQTHQYQSTSITLPRSEHLRQVKSRVFSAANPESLGAFSRGANRLLQISYIDKLMSPMFHVINSMEPWMISLPMIGGRHGHASAIREMNRIHWELGSPGLVGKGLFDTFQAMRKYGRTTDWVANISQRLAALPDGAMVGRVMTMLYDRNLMARDAGMELQKIGNVSDSMLWHTVDRIDLVARQMGTSIEAINRTVSAVPAFRLEYALQIRKGKTPAEAEAIAMQYAYQTVIDGMGDYSAGNAPPIFNNPVGKLALQFKKYALKSYTLMFINAARSLHGDPEAMKTLMGLAATHAVMAGTLGLPFMEIVKIGMIASQVLGISSGGYSDFEEWVRRMAAKSLGKNGGMALTRGVPRYLGLDLANRMGWDNLLLPFGEIKSTNRDAMLAYAAKAFIGAPGSLPFDWSEGMQDFANGDYAQAASKMVPIKLLADGITAGIRWSEGKKSQSKRETMSPYTTGEAVLRALGGTPTREAEISEHRMAVFGPGKRQTEERRKMMADWVIASPQDKGPIMKKINEWNKGRPEDARISLKQLVDLQQSRAKEKTSPYHKEGIATTRQTQHFRERADFYVTQ